MNTAEVVVHVMKGNGVPVIFELLGEGIGYQPGTVSRSMVKGAAKRYPANGQIALIHPYRKKIMRSGEEKIRFDSLSIDGQSYVACFYA